jgi:DNA repair protein RadC
MKKKKARQNTAGAEIHHCRHAGDKLVERGTNALTDAELLSILIGTGIKGKSAEKIAEEILAKYGSYKGMENHTLSNFLEIKGLGDVKIVRIAAAFEIAKRTVDRVIRELKEDQSLHNEVFGY